MMADHDGKAMAGAERRLRVSDVALGVADPASPEARACIAAYVQELQERFEDGFDPARSVSAEPGELVPPAGMFVLARLGGRAIGCGGLKVTGPGEARALYLRNGYREVARYNDNPYADHWFQKDGITARDGDAA